MSVGGLEPLDPVEATDMYIGHRRTELRDETLSAHYYLVKQFYEWCESVGIKNLSDLTPRDLHRYRAYRLNEQGNAVTTVRGDLFTLKKFLEFCGSIQAVPKGLSEYVDIPTVSADENTNDASISPERVKRILEHYETYEYAGRRHALFALAWHTGMRLGALRSIDLHHLHLEGGG